MTENNAYFISISSPSSISLLFLNFRLETPQGWACSMMLYNHIHLSVLLGPLVLPEMASVAPQAHCKVLPHLLSAQMDLLSCLAPLFIALLPSHPVLALCKYLASGSAFHYSMNPSEMGLTESPYMHGRVL